MTMIDLSTFQFGTWIPSLQIGNGVIQGQYADRIGNWTRVGHQIFVNAFFRLNYNEAQVEDARRRNTTIEEIRIGTMPYEAGSGSSIFNLMISNNNFVQNVTPLQTEILSIGARSIWGSPRMRVYVTERSSTNLIPLARDLSIQDIKPSTNGNFVEIRVSGTYTAFPDLSTTDVVNTPPPMVTPPPSPGITIGSQVRVNRTARTWATGQPIPAWVLGQTYRVAQTRNSGQEILLEGVNSWIKAEDVVAS